MLVHDLRAPHARAPRRRSRAWQFGENKSLVEGALRVDDLALSLDFIFYAAGRVRAAALAARARRQRTRASATTARCC